MRKAIISILAVTLLVFTASSNLKAEGLFFDDFQIGNQIGEDGGNKPTPFGTIPFPFVNLYNFPGWEYKLVKSSEAIITGINRGTSFCPEGWPHDYSTAPMSNRALVEDGMLGVANAESNRFLHLGGPFIPMFSPSENISVSKTISVAPRTQALLVEFDYLARTLDGIPPGEGEDNDKAYAKIEFINPMNQKIVEYTIWEWSQGTPGIGNIDTGMLYSDTDGGFAPFGKLVGDDPMNPESYAQVNLQSFIKKIKIPKGTRQIVLTFGLVTDADPWASCLIIDNVSITETRFKN